nr:ankyrin repeat-containing domain, PGG domain protein [Tanacetum cinerariifolium]
SEFTGYKVGTPVEESDALKLLKILSEDIVNLPKKDEYRSRILRGPPDSIMSRSGRIVQTIRLKQLIFQHLKNLHEEIRTIGRMTDEEEQRALKLKQLVSDHVANMHVETQKLIKQENTTDEDQALELQKLISRYIVKLHDQTEYYLSGQNKCRIETVLELIQDLTSEMRNETELRDRHSSQVMFMAAEVGNTNFLLELISQSHDLIWKVNDNNQTIFHVAVTHRHAGIYNLLYEIGAMKDMVTPLKDYNGNNMLHLAAMRTRKKNIEDVSGAALQMQRELLWFKEFESMIPPFRERKNEDGFTPRELFSMEHKELIDQGEKWMKSTASQCMVVATLIATIVFAAAFTVPGGYNQKDGIPMFKRKLSFVAFVVSDAISLFLSSASLLTFLSILTSRYAQRDFVASLPMKLMFGLAALFLSVGTMMVTFSVTFFVLYNRELKWIPIFIGLFAVTPAILYVALQYHLLIDVFRSTYGAKYLFKRGRQVLFIKKPEPEQTNINVIEDPEPGQTNINVVEDPEPGQTNNDIDSQP